VFVLHRLGTPSTGLFSSLKEQNLCDKKAKGRKQRAPVLTEVVAAAREATEVELQVYDV
jgi:hypothetical protein